MSLNLLSNERARELVIDVLENLRTHPIKTAEAFRNAILGDGYFAFNPTIALAANQKYADDLAALQNGLVSVVASGRMIDFGHLPNAVIKATSLRSREVFEAGEFEHPYPEWFAVSSWEGGMNGYLIEHRPAGGFLCVEYYGVAIPGKAPVVLLYDMIGIHPKPGNTKLAPCPLILPQSKEQDSLRAANSLDPLVCFLRLLADASIPVVGRQVDDRLNRARLKSGKPPIPPHHAVETRDYVSMFHASKAARTAKGGHHASPIAHWRRAHHRHLASGKDVHVRSSRVNWREPAEIHRLFTRVPHA